MSERKDDDVALWGELREGLHTAGYTFERACRRLENLLEGQRWKVGGRFKSVAEFLDSLRIDTLAGAIDAKKRLGARIKELRPDVSNRQIAKAVGTSHTTINK